MTKDLVLETLWANADENLSGEELASVPLVAAAPVPRLSWWQLFLRCLRALGLGGG